ncbi:unnamed protein product [Rotaria sp. Silwood1]|nr:unnamed protein product [Rotaria sp. Silwood1]CAF1026895.1 unnamed protein product [Rotaria sp. Silwood1]CAF1034802.1 unnamed protein product [Rotaria sp. Silwood1]CAF3405743.1 unnamed protein product [Rotaria sp. Silwood1]CAF3423488.1 unnamed protein product [Rotaria sp. Silwood1]
MTPRKFSYPFVAQAETLLIYGIFLFLTGLAQICVTISHRYIIARTIHHNNNINILSFLPVTFTLADIHLWYIYPSASLTIIPFAACVIYALFKRRAMAILICISSMISFISSSVYVGLLIVHTLEYWQTMSSYRYKTILSTTTTSTRILVPFDEPSTFVNLALLITFTLALVQALLSMIGAVISCLWSPCCMSSPTIYTPVSTSSHHAQTTPHRHETPQSSTLRSIKRQQQQQQQQRQETHRLVATNGHQDTMMNGFIHKNSSIRSHYDHV